MKSNDKQVTNIGPVFEDLKSQEKWVNSFWPYTSKCSAIDDCASDGYSVIAVLVKLTMCSKFLQYILKICKISENSTFCNFSYGWAGFPFQKMVCDIGSGAHYEVSDQMTRLMHVSPGVISPLAESRLRQLQQAFTVGRHVKRYAHIFYVALEILLYTWYGL